MAGLLALRVVAVVVVVKGSGGDSAGVDKRMQWLCVAGC
jgi:hypothetical protein